MSISRRTFLKAASAAGVTATLPVTAAAVDPVAPHRIRMSAKSGGGVSATAESGEQGGMMIPSSVAMASGAPLGGIGTGYISLRPDGGFYEWLIFNAGQWSPESKNAHSAGPDLGPDNLQFLIRARKSSQDTATFRRLYLQPKENNLYSLGYVQDVASIQFDAYYPMSGLHYQDSTLPVRVRAAAFSPFIPGKARESATPGFHMVFTVENLAPEKVTVSLLSLLGNPLAQGESERRLKNEVETRKQTTRLLFQTQAEPENKTTIGSLCLSVTGGEPSWVSGTFPQYVSPDLCEWRSSRANHGFMMLGLQQKFFRTGRLPNTSGAEDPAAFFRLSDAEIDALSGAEREQWLKRLSDDALLNQVISDAFMSDPSLRSSAHGAAELLKEIRHNLSGNLAGGTKGPGWGTGALASTVELEPGETKEIRFALSWFFPHHVSKHGEDLGHMYANWFANAGEVNDYLVENYPRHRQETELFARTLADTSLGDAMAFAWSSHLGTAITNTWWTKDGRYAIWEGLGCCGLSTMDTEYNGSFSQIALFPELKMSQMRHMLERQRENGQVPHTYDGDFDHLDEHGWGRVDMNPQFVMMVYRDYLWTGDKSYLEFMWPHVLLAMKYTGSLDGNGDGLPDHDCAFQTYDQWGMRGSPSYIASLWIGALKAAVQIAEELGKTDQGSQWQQTLLKASAAFDRILFNGKYYSLWVDGSDRDETCMSDQISGEWFSHLVGLPSTISQTNLEKAYTTIWHNNFNPDTGLRNATFPNENRYFLLLDNLQAGGVWSGIEFAFASFLMDQGHYEEGAQIVAAVHRRYLRAGIPWSHVECGSHYSRAMSSWATLLAATGFKPNASADVLTITPAVESDFHAPWVTAAGYGRIQRSGHELKIACASGELHFRQLRTHTASPHPTVTLDGKSLNCDAVPSGSVVELKFAEPVALHAGQTLKVE